MEQIKIPTRPRKIEFKSYWTYRDWLSQNGYSMLGSGAFGAALQTPCEDMALKVGHVYSENCSADSKYDGYYEWIKLVARLQNEGKATPNAPRIYSMSLYKAEDGSVFYAVYMEKLGELNSRKGLAYNQTPDVTPHRSWKAFRCAVNYIEEKSERRNRSLSRNKVRAKLDAITAEEVRAHVKEWATSDETAVANAIASLELAKMIVLTTVTSKYGLCLDLHDGNVMTRGSTFVVTDPIC